MVDIILRNTEPSDAMNSSLIFSYERTDTPLVTSGNSPLFPTEPIGTALVYSRANDMEACLGDQTPSKFKKPRVLCRS